MLSIYFPQKKSLSDLICFPMTSKVTKSPSFREGRGRLHLAFLSFLSAIIFALLGLFLPPQGEIDGSVLILVAQLLLFCATFLGIDNYVNIIRSKD